MKRVSKWAAGLVCTIAILGAIVFSPLNFIGPRAPVATMGGPRAPIANFVGPKAPVATMGGPRAPVF
jgi:hypothetical protein